MRPPATTFHTEAVPDWETRVADGGLSLPRGMPPLPKLIFPVYGFLN
jgi:hypothetical protein